jgi:hypothetical protein
MLSSRYYGARACVTLRGKVHLTLYSTYRRIYIKDIRDIHRSANDETEKWR